MRPALLALIPAAALAGGLAGWFGASSNPIDGVAAVAGGRQNAPGLSRPGQAAAASAAVLAQRLAPPPVAAAAPSPAAVIARRPAPPPPDVAAAFRAELTAVVRDEQGPRAVLASPSGRRDLAVGDMFRDGWRVAAIGRGDAVLTRAGETRRVAFYAP